MNTKTSNKTDEAKVTQATFYLHPTVRDWTLVCSLLLVTPLATIIEIS